jgi:hypothetical protein
VSHIRNPKLNFQVPLLMAVLCLPTSLQVPLHLTYPWMSREVLAKRLVKIGPLFFEAPRGSPLMLLKSHLEMVFKVLAKRPWKNCPLFVETPRVSHILNPNVKPQLLLSYDPL